MDYKKLIIDSLDENLEMYYDIAKKMYENPELAWHEDMACKLYADALKEQGFTVETGLYGIKTSIRASFGEGSPVVGLLAEYDALPDLSQTQDSFRNPIEKGLPGQGCGHNLLGTATLAAAIGAKEYLKESGKQGTIVFYGCPAEEVLLGKVFMAREGAFKELDAAYTFHPDVENCVDIGILSASDNAIFKFKGKSAHAGICPWKGRSALDACELMNVGANYLREHVTPDVRMHYTYASEMAAPNIVPDQASVWYYVRGLSRETVVETYSRLVKIAEGAAMMTETELEIEYRGGCYQARPNKVLADVLMETFNEIPPVEYTEDEINKALELNRNSDAFAGEAEPAFASSKAYFATADGLGSSDVSDVQQIVPCTTIFTTTINRLGGLHNWQQTCCAGNTIGWKGMMQAGKIMAISSAKLYEDPSLVEAAQKEFKEGMAGKEYICPIAKDVPVPEQE